MTYTTAQGNAGSSTQCSRPGMEPASSWLLVGFVTAKPRRELPYGFLSFLFSFLPSSLFLSFLLSFSFFLAALWHMEVPRPGIRSEPYWQPTPKLCQHWMLKPTVPSRGLNLHPRAPEMPLTPLHHSGNSYHVDINYTINIFLAVLAV